MMMVMVMMMTMAVTTMTMTVTMTMVVMQLVVVMCITSIVKYLAVRPNPSILAHQHLRLEPSTPRRPQQV